MHAGCALPSPSQSHYYASHPVLLLAHLSPSPQLFFPQFLPIIAYYPAVVASCTPPECIPTPLLLLLCLPPNVQVNGRIIRKRIHVRIEHVQPSRCREDFLRRRETNDKIKHEAKVAGGQPGRGGGG